VVEVLAEDTLDTVAAVTGSSMGFLALALEGVEEGAVSVGLPRPTARVFVRQTALAAALLLQSHAGSPADLKDQVASPGGSTIAGLAVLEDLGVRGAFIRAIEAAAEQSRRLWDLDCPPVIE
jgi:pyrroline-5-carboxylate reductase